MGNIRNLKTRIGSIISTRKITKAMKMVAASKLRKAQEKIISARPYANHVDLMLRTLKKKNPQSLNPLLKPNADQTKKVLVVVTADKGLCGGFNSTIIRMALHHLKEHPDTDIICLGKRGKDYIGKRSDRVIASFTDIFNEMDFSQSKKIADYLLDLYLNKGYGKIDILYNGFKSAIQQNVTLKTLLPIEPLTSDMVSPTNFIYEPDEDTIIEELGRKFVDVGMWRVMLESSAAEQGARMTAMDNATENASELVEALTLQYNRERQAGITTEILEIASGAEAIKN